MVALQRAFDVPTQLLEPCVAHRNSEVAPGDIFQFVRLVKDDRPDLGENAGIGCVLGLLFNGQVSKEKVMVHDNDVALHRPAVHLGNEALLPRAAFLAQAGVRAGIQLVPKGTGFGQGGELRAVSSLRGLLPRCDGAVVLDFVQAAQDRLIGQVVELLAAKIVVAAFHVADVQLGVAVRKKCLLQKRDIFVEELFLQVLGARGYDDALTGANHGNQIGQRLACAGAGFHDEMALFGEGLLDSLGHLQLSAPEFVCRMGSRQQAAGREEVVKRDVPFVGGNHGLGGRGHGVSIILSGPPLHTWGQPPSLP